MTYKYSDIIWDYEEHYKLRIGTDIVGKTITIKRDDPWHRRCPITEGVVTDVFDNSIWYHEVTAVGLEHNYITAKYFVDNPKSSITIYDKLTDAYTSYEAKDIAYVIPPRIAFNDNVLKSGAKFFMTTKDRCGIVEIIGFCLNDTNIKLIDADCVLGSKEYTINVNDELIKQSTWKPIKEVTYYDLMMRGFNGYDLSPSLKSALQSFNDDLVGVETRKIVEGV